MQAAPKGKKSKRTKTEAVAKDAAPKDAAAEGETSSAAAPAEEGAASGGSGVKIAVAPLQIEGELSEEQVAKVEQELLGGLTRAGASMVAPADAVPGGATLPCGESAGCIAKFAKANAASHVLQVKITKSGRDYNLDMLLSSGADGSTQAKSNQDCEICGLQELGELIGDQAAAFQPKLQAIPAMVIIETVPAGAMVKIDGRTLGLSPIIEQVEPGEHTISVSKAGYLERERKVTAVAGGEETVELALSEIPGGAVGTDPVDTGPDGKGMRAAGWANLGVGLGLLGGGATLLVLDEDPIPSRCNGFPENIDVNGRCRFRYDTLGAGIGLAAAGGAAVVTAGVLLGLGYKRRKQGKPAPGEGKNAYVLPTGTGVLVRF